MKANRIKPEELIQGLLHNASVAGGHPLEQRLADTALWFHANKDSIPLDNLAAKQAFLEKGFWCLLEISALLLERPGRAREQGALVPSELVSRAI